MAKSTKENDDVIVDVEEVYSKTEDFIEKNKKPIVSITIAVVLLAGLFYAYKTMYLAPLQEEAEGEMFAAEQYFEKDSVEKAVFGDGSHLGFIDIVESYGSTKAGNLAHYYLGISYLKMQKYEEAIDALNDFSSDDIILGSVALGAIGDANMELGNTEDAISHYKKAANRDPNNFITPVYLMKAAQSLEELNNYKEALALYKQIKEDYAESQEGRQIDKYIAKAESFVN